jgi:hypothetical protein
MTLGRLLENPYLSQLAFQSGREVERCASIHSGFENIQVRRPRDQRVIVHPKVGFETSILWRTVGLSYECVQAGFDAATTSVLSALAQAELNFERHPEVDGLAVPGGRPKAHLLNGNYGLFVKTVREVRDKAHVFYKAVRSNQGASS